MLIEKSLSVNDVACFKLSNGDEIIARITDINEKMVSVSKPMLMVLSQNPRTGEPGIQMAPFWIMGGDPESKYPIVRDHVVCMVKANSEALKGYTAHTSSLAIPGSGLIV